MTCCSAALATTSLRAPEAMIDWWAVRERICWRVTAEAAPSTRSRTARADSVSYVLGRAVTIDLRRSGPQGPDREVLVDVENVVVADQRSRLIGNAGRDTARVDRHDRVPGCERVTRVR